MEFPLGLADDPTARQRPTSSSMASAGPATTRVVSPALTADGPRGLQHRWAPVVSANKASAEDGAAAVPRSRWEV
jgi:hypothetical protein